LASYVKCEECGHESTSVDKYMDLSLPIRSDQLRNSSLEMALENYIKPERLEGDNQY